MSFQKFKSISFCVSRRHRSSTVKIFGDITSKCSRVLFGYCSVCNGKECMTVCDNTIKAEGLNSFFENLGKISAKAGKKLATNVLKNPAPALEIGANVATAAASRKPTAALSTEVINFYHTERGLHLGKFVSFYTI